MKTHTFLWAALTVALLAIPANAQESPVDVLGDPALDLRRAADRSKAVERMRVIENASLQRARVKAQAMGIPMRRELPEGRVSEIVGLDENGEFLIYTTRNANAAISSAANLVYSSPYNLDGSNVVVGVWDGGAVRVTHQEFGSRATVRDGYATLSSHATHVAGTVAAAGMVSTAKGMAPSSLIDSYHWTSDDSEMIAAGASSPRQQGKITVSNHSYGFVRGWDGNEWKGTGTDQNAYASQFGQYSSKAASWDSISYNAPYYLIFHSAGNDNSENPSNGAQVIIGGNTVTYDRAIHPPGDGLYRNTTTNSANGYENIGDQANSKNIVVVGAANDAVTNGLRDPSKSTLTSFSSRGPTDDGRIKPDIVANGASLYSTNSTGDTAYTTMSGTSMSGPSAAGSAALLVHLYRNLFPDGDMRASTLKGLILHTATDIGNPGPDYHYGWGLIDTKSAADVIIDHHADPLKGRMIEDQLNTTITSKTYLYNWDGSSPIRATICWTDPAGTSTTAHDSRISRLRNDLDIKLIAPDGTTQYYPFVMPYVGTWTVASMSAHATTGINSTDNVEQVLIQNPGQLGQWQIVVTHKGTLTNNLQNFSLITSGLAAGPPDMGVARGATAVPVGGSDAVSGTNSGAGTQLTYTISNTGGSPLQLTTPVTISGQSNCSVTVNTQPSSPVAANGSTNLVLTVTPGGGGWSFNVSIPNSDPDKNPYHWTVGGVASSETQVVLYPVADTYINDQSTGSNYGTQTDIRLNNRTNAPNKSILRGLIRFDLSSITGNPTLQSAQLDFVQDNANSSSVDIVEATGTWAETTATWSNSNTLFGDTSYGSVNTGSTSGAAVPTITLNATGLSKVQSWLTTPSGNHGFGITTAFNGNNSWVALRSREAVEASRPKLTLTYGGGSSTAPVMAVTGSQGGIPNGGSESVSGSVSGVASQLTYSIANLGNANLTLTTPVTATPVSNCSVSVTTQPTSPVASSVSTNLVLNVTPTTAGSWSATVSIANNDPSRNPYTWTISGSAFGSYTLTYNGNNSDSGTAPVDANSPYVQGTTVTVLGNTGSLIKAGSSFAGWNTAANGSGTTYQPGATFAMPASNLTLYALWNGSPTVDAGPDQIINLSGGDWTPLLLDPGLWLDASDTSTIALNGSTVSRWDDKSGFDRHATQVTASAQPTNTPTGLNGKRVLTFDGSNDLFEVNLDFLAGVSHSAFIVTRPTTFSNIYGAANASQAANSLHVGFASATNYRMNFWANDFGPAITSNFVAGSANIMNYVWNTGVGKQIFANGKSEGSNTNAGVIGTMSGGGRIGRTTNHAFFGGDIAEIILIPTVLSLDDRQALEGYLAHKWGLTERLAADHPYKTDPPVGTTATTTLAGSATDPENDPLTTQWTLQNGPYSMVFGNPSSLSSTATFHREGVYTLRLTADDGSGSVFDDMTVTVNPPAVERTLTYAGNGNTGGTAPVDPSSPYVDGSTVTVLGAGTLVKNGHTFVGWNTGAGGGGTAYAAGATFTINANTTLYAQWTPNTYTVTFNANGGGTPSPTNKQVTYGSTYGTLATVTRPGYGLDGWFTAAEGGAEVTSDTIVAITADQTLFAQWTQIPVSVVTSASTVHVPEGGTAQFQVKLSDQPAGNTTVTVARSSGDTDITVQSGGSLSFTTANWDTYQTVTLAAANDVDAVNGTATITCTPSDPAFINAQVTATEIDKDTTLTVASGGNGSTSPSGAVLVEKGANTSISASANTGYDFVNWTIPSGSATLGNANSASTTASITAPATVQANFTIRQYTLTYTAGTGGTISGTSPQTVNHGTNGTQVTAVPDSGYSFVKWSDNVLTVSRTDTGITSNLSVSAEFSANTYDVAFDANDGNAAVPTGKQVTFGAPYGALATTSRTGYGFNGWFTAASGGTEVTAATTVSTASNHTLYAQWTPDIYVVTYNGNENTSGTVPADQEKTHDVDLVLATNSGSLTRTGYTFIGWNTAPDGSGTAYAVGSTYAANASITLHAQWVTGTYLTWDANGATAGQTNGAGAWEGASLWWNGTGNQNWVSGGSATFGGPNTAGGAVTLAAPTTVENFTFNPFTGTYTLGNSGQAITLNSGIDKTAGSAALTFASPIALGGDQTWTNNSSGTLLLGNGTNLITNNGYQLTIDGTGTTSFGVISNSAATLSGSGALVKNGSGRLNVGGLNSDFTGSVAINGGVLHGHNNAGFLGNGNLTLRGGVLSFYWGTTYTRTLGTGVDQVRIPSGESGFAGAGTSGPTINLGTTVVWGASGEGSATGFFNPGKFVLGDSGTGNAGSTTFSSAIDFNGATRTILVPKGLSSGGNVSTISGAITSSTGAAGLIKEGEGTLILSAANTYTGDTTISGGNLRIGNGTAGTLNSGNYSGNISIASGASLQIWSTTAQTLSGTISGGGGLNKAYGGSLTLSGPNTYTGRTSFLPDTTAGFTVNVSSFNSVNGGTPLMASSSLGAPTTVADGTIDLGSSGKRASVTLNYTGPGETTDRVINLGFNDSSSQTISASGSGLLRFTSAMTSNATIQTGQLILSGTGGGEITEALPALPTGGLLKNGNGIWILGGDNTYPGATTVSAGKLFINGDQSAATGDLSVAANATLGGTGTIGGNTTIAVNGRLEFDLGTDAAGHDALELASTRTLTFSGASVLTITTSGGAVPGTYTLVTAPGGITGSAPATLNLPVNWVATTEISGNSLVLNVTSTGSGPGPVDHFVISPIASPQTIGTAITGITITAQDSANETATSFTGTVTFGGTTEITGTSASFVDGVLSGVSITPMVAGTDLTFTVDDGAGHTGTATFTVQSLFDDWAGGGGLSGGDADPGADPDGDGLTNLQEFAFGTDPTAGRPGPVQIDPDGKVVSPGLPDIVNFADPAAAPEFRAVFPRRKDYVTAGLIYTVEFSADLTRWTASAAGLQVLSTESAGDMEAVSVPFPATVPVADPEAPEQAPKFFRVAVATVPNP